MKVSAEVGVMWFMPGMKDFEVMVELNTWISFAKCTRSSGFTP